MHRVHGIIPVQFLGFLTRIDLDGSEAADLVALAIWQKNLISHGHEHIVRNQLRTGGRFTEDDVAPVRILASKIIPALRAMAMAMAIEVTPQFICDGINNAAVRQPRDNSGAVFACYGGDFFR